MTYRDDFSLYRSENILNSPSKPAHSGPDVCNEFPRSSQAETLAREVVLDRISLQALERPLIAAGSGLTKGLKYSLK
jgi:hypothetical protein